MRAADLQCANGIDYGPDGRRANLNISNETIWACAIFVHPFLHASFAVYCTAAVHWDWILEDLKTQGASES